MSLTGLCIELRPNLRSGVVFLQFDHNIADRNETRLVIREHNVYIAEKSPDGAASNVSTESTSSDSDSETDEDEEEDNDAEVESLVIRHDCFGMDIGCISIFVVTGNHISFRFNYTQIDLDALDGSAVQVPMAPLLLSCRENEAITLTCRDCRAELVEERTYRRLREFPSCVVDPSEFFCHNHGGTGCGSEAKVPTLPSLVPAPTDLFYGLNYVVVSINRDQNPSILNRDDHLYCKRCMRYLGVALFNGAAARLWADAVRWLPGQEGGAGDGGATAVVPRHFFQSSSMTQLVKRLLYSLWPQPLPQLCLSTSRAVLVTSLPSCRRHQYMFIHVVESQLRVLRRIQPDSQQLRCYRACKLYYGVFGASSEQEQEPPLLQQWQAQQTVPQMEISPGMFQTLQERFELNTQLIPSAWRLNSASEGLQLSYFFYEDEAQPEGVLKADDEVPFATRLGKMQLQEDLYETDAGHASSESESDDEHSDSDEGAHSVERRTPIKRCPTPLRHCHKLSTSTSSASSEDK